MYKQRLGSDFSRRPGGPGRPGAKPNESASEVWQSFIGSHIALSQLIHDFISQNIDEMIDDDDEEDADVQKAQMEENLEMLSEQIGALDGFKKKKLTSVERRDVICMIDESYAEMLGSLALIDSDDEGQRGVELQAEELFAAALTSTLAYCAACSARRIGPGGRTLAIDDQDEADMTMKLISTLICCTVSESKYAKSALQTTAPALVKLLLGIGMNEQHISDVRDTSFAVLSDIVENAPTIFSPSDSVERNDVDVKSLIDSMLNSCYSLCSDLRAVDLNIEKGANQNYGTILLDVLATNIMPNSYVAQAILDRSTRDMQTENDRENKGALVCLAVLPSSDPSFADSNAEAIWNIVKKGLNHATMIVRASALVAAGEFVENSSVAYKEFGRLVIDAAWNTLDDKEQPISKCCLGKCHCYRNPWKQSKLRACVALSQVIRHHHDHDDHEKESIISLTDVVPRVLALVKTVDADWRLIEALISIIHAAVEADETDSVDYKSTVQPLLSVLSRAAHSAARIPARSVITSVLAMISEDAAKAKEIVSNQGTTISNALKSNAHIQDSDVRSATHRCWFNFASSFGVDLIPHLAHIVPTITRVFSQEYTPGGAPSQAGNRNDDDEEDDELDETEMEAQENEAQQVDDERVAALALYRELLEVLGVQMLEFNDKIWPGIVQQSQDWSGSVQEQVAKTIPAFVKLFSRTSESKFVVGESSQLPADAEIVLQQAVTLMLSYIRLSSNPSTVARSLDAVACLIDEFGRVMLMQTPADMESFITAAKCLLKGQGICQKNMKSAIPSKFRQHIEAARGLVQDDDQEEHDDHVSDDAVAEALGAGDDDDKPSDAELIVRSLLDCLASFAKARGPAFQSVTTARSDQ